MSLGRKAMVATGLWHRTRGAALRAALTTAMFGGSAFAGGSSTTDVSTSPITWTLDWTVCPKLPHGTTITATGTARNVLVTNIDGGVTSYINANHSDGTATDQDGNSYKWSYTNEYDIANTVAAPDYFSGRMVDHFVLQPVHRDDDRNGDGEHERKPTGLNNGFLTHITFGPNPNWPNGVYAVPILQYGLPLTFPYFTAPGCDPI